MCVLEACRKWFHGAIVTFSASEGLWDLEEASLWLSTQALWSGHSLCTALCKMVTFLSGMSWMNSSSHETALLVAASSCALACSKYTA